jgi:hypothetical protein
LATTELSSVPEKTETNDTPNVTTNATTDTTTDTTTNAPPNNPIIATANHTIIDMSNVAAPGIISQNSSTMFCKICLTGESSEQLLQPCLCKGNRKQLIIQVRVC